MTEEHIQNEETKDLISDETAEDQASNPNPTDADETDSSVVSDEPSNRNKEAAKYRRQLREVEAERDQLKESLNSVATNMLDDRLSRSNTFTYTPDPDSGGNMAMKESNGHYMPKEITNEIRLRNPGDFLPLTGLNVTDLTDETGLLDDTKLQDEIVKLYTDRPELFVTKNKPVNSVGKTGQTVPTGAKGFEAAFTRKTR